MLAPNWINLHEFVGVCVVTLTLFVCCKAAHDNSEIPRFQAQSFRNSTTIQGSQVHCGVIPSRDKGNSYASDVWACYNISIAGHRLEYETGLGHVYKEGENSDKIKSDFTGSNDLLQLCRFLMRAHGIHQQLWFAQAKDITMSSVPLRRIVLMRSNPDDPSAFEWKIRKARNGYIGTLLCTAVQQQQ